MLREDLQREAKWTRSFLSFCKIPWWLLIISPAILCHCSQGPKLNRSVDHFINTQWPSSISPANETDTFSFKEAVRRAIQFNEPILQALGESDLSAIDVSQAKSELWPRFDIQASGQIPIGGDSDSDNNTLGDNNDSKDIHIRGGLYMRYDFHKALFRSDTVAAARTIQRKRLEEANGLMVGLAYDLFDRLVEIELLRKEVSLRTTMVDQAKKGARTAQRQFRLRMVAQPLIWQWDTTVQTQERLLKKAHNDLTRTQRTVGFMLGGVDPKAVEITDFNQVAAKLEGPLPENLESIEFLREVWKRLPRCRMAEMNLFLSEIAILQAKRKRVPRMYGSLGVGSFNVLSDDEKEVPAALELGVSLPLFDWGDIRRNVNKAEHRKAWAERRIRLLVKRLQYDIDESRSDLDSAKTQNGQALKTWQAMQDQARINGQRLQSNLIQPLEALRFDLEAGHAEIAHHQSVANLLRARAKLNRHLGFPLIDIHTSDLNEESRDSAPISPGATDQP